MRTAFLALAFLSLSASSTAEEVEALIEAGKLEQGFRLAEQLAASGDREGDDALGWFYDQGKFVAEDNRKAVQHYRKAAEAGIRHAQWRLGVMLDEGEGVEADPAEAFSWLSKAGAQDYPKAMVSLGVMHAMGRGTTVDYGKSRDWYLKAARAGEPHGFFGIGVLHAKGQGVPEDQVEALAWLMAAAALGDEQAKQAAEQAGMDHDRTQAAADRATAILAEFGHPNRKVRFRDLDREKAAATPNA
jgi:TPR repeat protein